MLKRISPRQINQLHGHKFITGLTQSGKTYCAKELLISWPYGGIFWNPQEVYTNEFTSIDSSVDVEFLKRLLSRGCKLSYNPKKNLGANERELMALVNIMDSVGTKQKPIMFLGDEVQDYDDLESMQFIARRGLARGVQGVFTVQSAADVKKVFPRQSEVHIHFNVTNYDVEYYRRYKLPIDEVKAALKEGGQYSFVLLNFSGLTGEYMEGPLKIA